MDRMNTKEWNAIRADIGENVLVHRVADAIYNAIASHEAKHHGLDSFAEKDAAHKRLAEAIHEREQEALEALAELDEANAALAAAIKERDALRAIVDAARAVRSTGFQSRRADDGGRFLVGDDEYRALVNALEKEARDGTV